MGSAISHRSMFLLVFLERNLRTQDYIVLELDAMPFFNKLENPIFQAIIPDLIQQQSVPGSFVTLKLSSFPGQQGLQIFHQLKMSET